MNPNQQEEQPLMSEERRAFLRSIEDVITPERRELLDEIDRLRAENERLANHLHSEHYCQHAVS